MAVPDAEVRAALRLSLGHTSTEAGVAGVLTALLAAVDRARGARGCDALCTGHYAQVRVGQDGPELHRAVDQGKDQSYVLGVLTADQLAWAMFPLGDTDKVDVRAEAARRGLAVAEKPDSHDIC